MAAARAKSVLIVDDDPMILEVVRIILAQIGFEDVDQAADGGEALARLRLRKFDLVISDWNMVPMGGLELLRSIRANEMLHDTPFVMMTTVDHAHHFKSAGKAGVSACLVKPFSPAGLKAAITTIFANRTVF